MNGARHSEVMSKAERPFSEWFAVTFDSRCPPKRLRFSRHYRRKDAEEAAWCGIKVTKHGPYGIVFYSRIQFEKWSDTYNYKINDECGILTQ